MASAALPLPLPLPLPPPLVPLSAEVSTVIEDVCDTLLHFRFAATAHVGGANEPLHHVPYIVRRLAPRRLHVFSSASREAWEDMLRVIGLPGEVRALSSLPSEWPGEGGDVVIVDSREGLPSFLHLRRWRKDVRVLAIAARGPATWIMLLPLVLCVIDIKTTSPYCWQRPLPRPMPAAAVNHVFHAIARSLERVSYNDKEALIVATLASQFPPYTAEEIVDIAERYIYDLFFDRPQLQKVAHRVTVPAHSHDVTTMACAKAVRAWHSDATGPVVGPGPTFASVAEHYADHFDADTWSCTSPIVRAAWNDARRTYSKSKDDAAVLAADACLSLLKDRRAVIRKAHRLWLPALARWAGELISRYRNVSVELKVEPGHEEEVFKAVVQEVPGLASLLRPPNVRDGINGWRLSHFKCCGFGATIALCLDYMMWDDVPTCPTIAFRYVAGEGAGGAAEVDDIVSGRAPRLELDGEDLRWRSWPAWFPINLNTYLSYCHPLDSDGKRIDGVEAGTLTWEWLATEEGKKVRALDPDDAWMATIEGTGAHLGLYGIAGRMREGHIVLCYPMFYANNPDVPVALLWGAGGHKADLEFVYFILDSTGTQLHWAYMTAHGSREHSWVRAENMYCNNLEFKAKPYLEAGERPCIFVALNSHAVFWEPGTHWRIFGVTADICSTSGRMIDYAAPDAFTVMDIDRDPVFKYDGRMGPDGVGSFRGDRLSISLLRVHDSETRPARQLFLDIVSPHTGFFMLGMMTACLISTAALYAYVRFVQEECPPKGRAPR